MGEKLYTPALRRNKKRCRKRGSAMYRNLKSFDFIITAGIFVYSAWSLLEMSEDPLRTANILLLVLISWDAVRKYIRQHKEKNTESRGGHD